MEDLQFSFTFPEDFDFDIFAVKGDKGDKGDTGVAGPTGPQGEQGVAGQDGRDGADAKINGVNTITIVAGTNISLDQSGNVLTINNTYTDDESTKANKTEAGNNLLVSIDNATYVMTLKLRDIYNNVISTQTVDLPLETMVVNGSYDSVNKKIILTLQNGNTIEFSIADLVSGLQSEITSSNKLSADLVDDINSTNKFTNSTEKTSWNGKYAKPSGGIPKTDLASAVQTSLGKADISISKFSTMPTANATYENEIIQYIGATDSIYTNGYFYKCVSDGGTYSWVNLQVQDGKFGEITQDTRIYTLNEGIYNVVGNVKVYYNDSQNSYMCDLHNYSLFVGPKYTDGNDIYTPYIIYINYKDLSYHGANKFGRFLYMGLSMTGQNGSTIRQMMSYQLLNATEEQTISGKKTFNVLPESSVVPTTNNQLVNKKYVDDTINNKIWIGTQIEYDNLPSYSDSVVYFIKETTNVSE